MEFSATFNKVIAHKSTIDNTRKDYNDNLFKIDKLKGDLEILNGIYKTTELGYTYLNRLVNNESEKFIKKLQELITSGLQTIFYDRDYTCDIRLEESSANLHLVYTNEEGNIVSPNIRDGVGGGVRTVVGFLSQVFFINHYKAEKLVLVDEGFSAIDDKYMPMFIQFIKELAISQGFKILLITHDNRLVDHADRVYRIHKGKSKLEKGLELTAGSGSEEIAVVIDGGGKQ